MLMDVFTRLKKCYFQLLPGSLGVGTEGSSAYVNWKNSTGDALPNTTHEAFVPSPGIHLTREFSLVR